jgi:hypothetical protein
MGLLDNVKSVYPDEKNKEKPNQAMQIDQMYGYEDMTEEQKANVLMKFLEYVKESKERDRARLQQSRMI